MADPIDDRLKILLDQLDAAWEMLDARMTGRRPWQGESGGELTLTDEEFFWEPVPGCWNLRKRGEAQSPNPFGKGEWVLDTEWPPPDPAPFTTIAWRMCHITWSPLTRYDYTFGTHSLTHEDVVWPGNARDGWSFVQETHRKWRTALETLTPAELDQVGRCDSPYGRDPNERFIDLLAWCNLEFGHHAAEIACLRDLYRATKENRNG